MRLFFYSKEIWRSYSMLRIMMNESLREITLSGRVIDVGGGKKPGYYQYFNQELNTTVEVFDGRISGIDFEVDQLPVASGTADCVVSCNVLEHIYNHNHLVSEMHRILKIEGRLIGFVPFIIQYHPDPHDYFRYTKEALAKMLASAGFKEIAIRPIGLGPIMANFNNLMLYMPRFFRVVLFPIYYSLSLLTIYLRPNLVDKFPLGFTFTAKK